MDWKADAADKLRCYRAKKSSIEGLENEIQGLEEELADLRAAPASRTREEAIIENLAQQDVLKRSLEKTKSWLQRVNKGLAVLGEDQRRILSRFYVSNGKGSIDRLCQELGIDMDEANRHREKALRYFTLALYGTTEI